MNQIKNKKQENKMIHRGIRWVVPAILFSFLLASCAIKPRPFSAENRWLRILEDTEILYKTNAPVNGPITIYEAMARAIRFNMDHRVKQLEAVLAGGQLELAHYDMFPRLLAEAALNTRNNFSGGTSISLLDGTESLVPSTSEEKTHWINDLRMTWSVLDLGIGYIKTKQQADVYLVSRQRQRRIIHNIIQDVRSAYLRAVTAEQRMREIDALMPKVQESLQKARTIEKEGLQQPLKILEYQRDLLERYQTLLAVKTELAVAKAELAALMNLPPGCNFSLVPVETNIEKMSKIKVDPTILDELALISRPELAEEDYLERVATNDVIKAWVETFPNISLDISRNFDSNDLIFYPYWSKGIFTATGQIMAMVTAKQRLDQATIQEALSRTRRMALSMAIMAQTRVAYMRYLLAYDNYDLVSQLDDINKRIYIQIQNAHKEKAQHGLELVRAGGVAIGAGIQNDIALNELQNAKSSLFLSIGLDPVPLDYEQMTLEEMTCTIEENMRKWDEMQPDEFFQLVDIKHIMMQRCAAADAKTEATMEEVRGEEAREEKAIEDVEEELKVDEAAKQIEEEPKEDIALNKIEEELKASQEAAEEAEQQLKDAAAQKKIEEELKASQAAAEEAEKQLKDAAAKNKIEEELKASQAQAEEIEKQRQAEEAEKQLRDEAARKKIEEELKASQAAAEEAEQQLRDEAARNKIEEELKASQAAAEEVEKQRQAEEAKKKIEEELKASQAQAEEVEKQRQAEEAKSKIEEELKASQAQAEKIEKQRQAEEAKKKIEEELKASQEEAEKAEEAEKQIKSNAALEKMLEDIRKKEALETFKQQVKEDAALEKIEEEVANTKHKTKQGR